MGRLEDDSTQDELTKYLGGVAKPATPAPQPVSQPASRGPQPTKAKPKRRPRAPMFRKLRFGF